MRWKSTVVLLVLTVATAAYVSLYELRQPDQGERRYRASQVFAVPEGAARLTLAFGAREPVVLTRDGEAWRIAPAGLRTDPARVGGLLGALTLRASRTFTPAAAQPLSDFGLAPPEGTITMTANGHDTVLLIGGTTPVAGSRYVKRADRPEVHVVNADAVGAADHPAEDFRDHALLRFEPSDVQRVAWTDGDTVLRLSRQGDGWQMEEPTEAAAADVITHWLGQWSTLPIAQFVNDAAQPTDRTAAGVDAPVQRLELGLDGGRSLTASFGAAVTGDAALRAAGVDTEPSALYAVADVDLTALKKSRDELTPREAAAGLPAAGEDVAPGAQDALDDGHVHEDG
ncbi:MAG: DUF4340 domain-containing protein, partial [Gemmatimonadales bacterium]|nr:DUF4340 domain-containing protein [Gemmatimonadales bacterium]